MKQKFKGDTLTQKKCINAILRFYKQATTSERKAGLIWYNEAHQYALELAGRFGLSVQQASGIIAALSPQCGWIENKRFAVTFLLRPNGRVKNRVEDGKARAILSLTKEDAIYQALALSGKAFKTKSFFLNISNPDIQTNVTIDRHAIASCLQTPDTVEALSNAYGHLTETQYNFFQSCYIHAAGQVGVLPHQLQAIVWITYRRLRDLRAHPTDTHWQPFSSPITF